MRASKRIEMMQEFMPPRRARVAIDVAALAAFALSTYLMLRGAGPTAARLPGCGGEVDCHLVTGSHWAWVGPFSVASLGVGCYLSLVVISLFTYLVKSKRSRVVLWSLLVVASLIGSGYIIWLILLQWLVIQHFCIYCLFTHVFGAAAFYLILRHAPVWKAYPRGSVKLAVPATLGLTLLVGAHILLAPSSTVVEAAEARLPVGGSMEAATSSAGITIGHRKSRVVYLLNDNLHLDLWKVPLLGPVDAEYVILDLFDYACPSCRKVYGKMKAFEERYQGRIAVVPLPVPMESDCNPDVKHTLAMFKNACTYARYGMAVCRADREAFETYHDWLMTGRIPPSPKKARVRAEELVGREAFEKALQAPEVDQWIQDGISIYRLIEGKTLPKLITRDKVISSSGVSQKKLIRSLEEALGLSAPGN